MRAGLRVPGLSPNIHSLPSPHCRPVHATAQMRAGPGFQDSLAAWMRWIAISVTPPILPRSREPVRMGSPAEHKPPAV